MFEKAYGGDLYDYERLGTDMNCGMVINTGRAQLAYCQRGVNAEAKITIGLKMQKIH